MSTREDYTLHVNGKERRAGGPAGATLLTVLREDLRLSGTKRGCNQGVCGSCTVSVDGWPVRACLSLAAACQGRQVVTIEGAGADPRMQVLQRHFAAHGAVQCGFCTAGMLISALRIIADVPAPTVEDVQAGLSGNICRCTGYRKIVEAVRAAAEEIADAS